MPQLDLETLLARGAGLAVAGAAKAGVPGAQQINAEGRLANRVITVTAWACGAGGSTLLASQVVSLGRTWPACSSRP